MTAGSIKTTSSRGQTHDISQLKASIDLLDFVREKIELKRDGREWKGLCPFHKETTASFRVNQAKQVFHCFGCTKSGDVFTWLKLTENLDFHGAVARIQGSPAPKGPRFISASGSAVEIQDRSNELRDKLAKARRIWNEAVPAHGTIVERYLESRGLGGIVLPPTLRFHPKLWNQESHQLMPGMVAVVTDNRQQIVGVHRTYLRSDGRAKASLSASKMMLGACRGSHVWLGLPVEGRLAIAEGIETAMTIMKVRPEYGVWASLTLGNMDAPVPQSVRELMICADGDNKDPNAAESVLQNAVRKHRANNPDMRVRIARPQPGKDFNDMLMAVRPEASFEVAGNFLPQLQEPRR